MAKVRYCPLSAPTVRYHAVAVARSACIKTTGGPCAGPLAMTWVIPKLVGTSTSWYGTGQQSSTAPYEAMTMRLPSSLTKTGRYPDVIAPPVPADCLERRGPARSHSAHHPRLPPSLAGSSSR
jgi:hypothetical protein